MKKRNGFEVALAILLGMLMTVTLSPSIQGKATSLSEVELDNFSHTGTFDELLMKLAVEVRSSGVFGFEPAPSAASTITISLQDKTTVKKVLEQLCARDQRYKFVVASDTRVINVVPVIQERVSQLLAMRVSRFDVSLDEWPNNWYRLIPNISAEVHEFLVKVYDEQLHPIPPAGSGGANMQTNLRPPHLELHLKNVSVCEILNALASKGLDWAGTENMAETPEASRPTVFYPVFSLGWQVKLPLTDDRPLNNWVSSVFSAFPGTGQRDIAH